MNQFDARDAERLKPLVKSCVGRIDRTTATPTIVEWAEELLRGGNPVRFGRMVFEVNGTQGRYYAGDTEEARRGDDRLWAVLQCQETVDILGEDEEGTPFRDIHEFARKAVKTWFADGGDNPPGKMVG